MNEVVCQHVNEQERAHRLLVALRLFLLPQISRNRLHQHGDLQEVNIRKTMLLRDELGFERHVAAGARERVAAARLLLAGGLITATSGWTTMPIVTCVGPLKQWSMFRGNVRSMLTFNLMHVPRSPFLLMQYLHVPSIFV